MHLSLKIVPKEIIMLWFAAPRASRKTPNCSDYSIAHSSQQQCFKKNAQKKDGERIGHYDEFHADAP